MTHVISFVVGGITGGAIVFFAVHRRDHVHVEIDLGDKKKDGPFYE